jgi:hypothetical protein
MLVVPFARFVVETHDAFVVDDKRYLKRCELPGNRRDNCHTTISANALSLRT